MSFTLIDLKVENSIATITLNRPDKRNAMSDDMRSEFIDALERVAADKAIKALVLTGAGKGFCAGGDISGMQRRMNAPAGEVGFNGWHRQQRVHHTQALLHTMPKPVIAAVNGAASGLGADTALACDFIIASEWASFSWSYIHRGIIPDGGGMYFLPRRVGLPKAKDSSREGGYRRSAGPGHRRPQDPPPRCWPTRGRGPPAEVVDGSRAWQDDPQPDFESPHSRSSRRAARPRVSATRAPSTASR
jgi:hypothetical protein